MIVSFIDGRVRIRDQRLRNASFTEQLTSMAAAVPGILSLEINPVVGSALIYYDPQKISADDLMAANEHLFGGGLPEKPKPPPRAGLARALKKRAAAKTVHRGLALALMATGITGGLGRERPHACLGLAMLGLAGFHIWQKTAFRRRKRAAKPAQP